MSRRKTSAPKKTTRSRSKKNDPKKRIPKEPIDLAPPPPRVGDRELHPASILPELGPEEQATVERMVEKLGQVRPVVVRNGRILDGRGLARAVAKAGGEIRAQELPEGEDPLIYVLESGLAGRRWTRSQLGLTAGRAASYKPGRPSKETVQGCTLCLEEAAKLCGVSRRLAASARAVLKTGCPKLVRAVELNLVSLTRAERLAKRPVEEQEALLERLRHAGTAGERAKTLAAGASAAAGSAAAKDDGTESITKLARIIRASDDSSERFEDVVETLARKVGLKRDAASANSAPLSEESA